MIITRYKALTKGGFRIYFDYYDTTTKKRKYKFTKLAVSKDYSAKNNNGKAPKFNAADREQHNEADQEKSKWLELLGAGTEKVANVKIGAIEYLDKFDKEHEELESVTVLLKTTIKEFADEDIRLSAINDAQWVKNFNTWLVSNRAYNTRRSIITSLKRLLREAVIDKKALPVDMGHSFKVSTRDKKETKHKFLTEEQVLVLKQTPYDKNEHLKQAFLFGCGTGLRLSDLTRVKWSNIHNGKLSITPYKTRRKDKRIDIPLKKLALDALEIAKKERKGELIFWAMPKTSGSARTMLMKWAKDAELKDEDGEYLNLSVHQSRHTFAVLALNAGVSVWSLQKLMAHSDIKTTLNYAKMLDKTAQEELIDKFPDI